MHDLVIKNAVLVDGVGTPAFEERLPSPAVRLRRSATAKASARGGQELMRKG